MPWTKGNFKELSISSLLAVLAHAQFKNELQRLGTLFREYYLTTRHYMNQTVHCRNLFALANV